MNPMNLWGYPVYIATKEWQKKKHHKKRINKKWLKRYGTYQINLMSDYEIVHTESGLYMTKKTYEALITEMKGEGKL